jgi:POT family proton-dependent oligopeptide transporter
MEQATIQKGHPKGLYLLFFTEMWERFSYYGMRAIFTLFMANALLFDKSLSSTIYGNYTGLVYLTPLLGGYIADKYWGNRRSILVGGILMAIGQFFMFMSASFYSNSSLAATFMFTGLGFLIFGNGFFKPNISTLVGQLYTADDKRVDSAFTIFYMGINLGAFFAPLVCGTLGEVYVNGVINPASFKWGFLAACIGMIVSTISFELLKGKYLVSPTGDAIGVKPKQANIEGSNPKAKSDPKQIAFWIALALSLFVIFKGFAGFDTIGAFIYSACIVAPATIITDKSLTKSEKDRIWVIFIIAFFVIFFWSAFEQAGASLTFFAQEQTNRMIGTFEVKSSYFQSINAVAIVIFAPLFAILWTTLGKKNREPASPIKQAIGLFLLSMGYLIIAIGVKDLNPSVKVSMMWLVTLYTVHTFGELCLSPIGLSMVVKLAPVRFASLLMGVWFLSTATANKFAGDLSALYPEEVKLEKSVTASQFIFNTTDSLADKNVAIDSLFVTKLAAMHPHTIMKVSLDTDDDAIAPEPSFADKFLTNLLGAKKSGKKDSLIALSPIKTSEDSVSMFQMKQIVAADAKYAYAKFFNEDGTKLYVLKSTKSLEIWNLKPEKPSFVGIQISSLYHFFMIFVIMAGGASIILFFLSKKLLKMMDGVK